MACDRDAFTLLITCTQVYTGVCMKEKALQYSIDMLKTLQIQNAWSL
jgi:hypothetical protein